MKTLAFVLALTSLLASGAAQAMTEDERQNAAGDQGYAMKSPALAPALTALAVDALTGAAQTQTICRDDKNGCLIPRNEAQEQFVNTLIKAQVFAITARSVTICCGIQFTKTAMPTGPRYAIDAGCSPGSQAARLILAVAPMPAPPARPTIALRPSGRDAALAARSAADLFIPRVP